MKLHETKIDTGGLFRCCIATLRELDPEIDYPDGHILDCKYEKEGNANLILSEGYWKWNNQSLI